MSDLEWYPADWVDESCPPARPSPLGFVFFSEPGKCWMLGYPPGEKSVCEDDRQIYNDQLDIGDVIDFVTCERLGEVEITLYRDGSYDLHGATIPPGHNNVMVDGDSDTICGDFEELIAEIKSPEDEFSIDKLIFEDGVDQARVTVSFANWSDQLPHLFEVKDGKPVFTPVPETKN